MRETEILHRVVRERERQRRVGGEIETTHRIGVRERETTESGRERDYTKGGERVRFGNRFPNRLGNRFPSRLTSRFINRFSLNRFVNRLGSGL